jgi:hypothetical protein
VEVAVELVQDYMVLVAQFAVAAVELIHVKKKVTERIFTKNSLLNRSHE